MSDTITPRLRIKAQPEVSVRAKVVPPNKVRLRVTPALLPMQIELQNTGAMVQWRYLGQNWQDLIEIDDINASVTVGTVTTLPPGSSATVVNVGTAQDMVLNFGIPAGVQGIQGEAATIAVGTVTTVGPATPAAVTNVGTPNVAVFNFSIPQGAAATITVGTVTTLAPGASATVTNVGTAGAAIFNFGIPQGAPGTGDVNGPASAVDNRVAVFNGTTGKLIKDSGVILGTVAPLNVDTDAALAANSDTRVASQKATKAYVDQIIAAQDAMVFKGVIDCSANPNYPAADRGWTYRVSVAGKIGGASGINVEAGDILLCLTDGTASGNQATVGTAWTVVQTNLDGAVIGPSSVTDSNPVLFDGTTGKLIKQSTYAAFKTALALVKGDVGLGNVDNTSDATKNSAAATLTNKRITARVFSEASNATPTPAGDSYDQHNITAQAAAAAFAAPTGTPTDGQKLIIRIKDNGTARAISWNAIYRALGVALPATTVLGKTLYLGFIYNAADAKWDLVASAQEA